MTIERLLGVAGLALVLLLTGCSSDQWLQTLAPPDEVAVARRYLGLLAAGNVERAADTGFAGARQRLDPARQRTGAIPDRVGRRSRFPVQRRDARCRRANADSQAQMVVDTLRRGRGTDAPTQLDDRRNATAAGMVPAAGRIVLGPQPPQLHGSSAFHYRSARSSSGFAGRACSRRRSSAPSKNAA